MMVFIWQYLKKYKGLLILAIALATINQVFSLLDPQIFRLIVDNYASKAASLPTNVFIKGILVLLLASMGVALISRIAKNFQDYYVNVISQRMGTDMYAQSVRHTFSLPYSVFEDQRSGEVLQKLQKARTDSQKFFMLLINSIFLALVGLVFVIIYAFIVHWSIGLTYLLMVPTLGTFAFILTRKIKGAQQKIVAESASLAGSTTETLRNVELVKSLGLEKQEIDRLNKVNEKVLELELKKVKLLRKMGFSVGKEKI